MLLKVIKITAEKSDPNLLFVLRREYEKYILSLFI